jgi:hypothetical protein
VMWRLKRDSCKLLQDVATEAGRPPDSVRVSRMRRTTPQDVVAGPQRSRRAQRHGRSHACYARFDSPVPGECRMHEQPGQTEKARCEPI